MGWSPGALGRPVWSRSLQAAVAASHVEEARRRQVGFVEAQLGDRAPNSAPDDLALARASHWGRVTTPRKKVAGEWNRIGVGAFQASSLFTMAGGVPW